jgi:hypothetical protein
MHKNGVLFVSTLNALLEVTGIQKCSENFKKRFRIKFFQDYNPLTRNFIFMMTKCLVQNGQNIVHSKWGMDPKPSRTIRIRECDIHVRVIWVFLLGLCLGLMCGI